jgi:hypothetical protein
VDVDHYVPDFERQVGDITLELFLKDKPMSASNIDEGTYTIAEGDDVVDPRLGGRYIGRRITTNSVDGDFREGTPLVHIGGAGQRSP